MTDESRLSPGQSLTGMFPVVGEKKPSSQIRDWSLKITGLVPREIQFSLAEFQLLPTVERVWDTICVTSWTHLDHPWSGVLLDTLLAMAKPLPEARFVRFIAYSNRGHDTSLPLDYARPRLARH